VRLALVLLALALMPTLAAGAALTLDENGRREAIRTGEQSVSNDAFDAEWRVNNGRGEWVSVLTPFHRLVMAARNATFNGKPLKPGEPEKILKEDRDRLVLWVELYGGSENFARRYLPRLVLADREIKAAFVQNEHTASPQQDGRYLARCVYGFPSRDLDSRSKASLVVADADGRDVSRFVIDLGKMR
jgi:hypothetical protein